MLRTTFFNRLQKPGVTVLRVTLIAFITFFSMTESNAQASEKALLKGKVLDSLSAAPLGFATVSVYSSVDKKLINGNISTETGDFSIGLPYGAYYAEINFIGYRIVRTTTFQLSKENSTHDLGVISLAQQSTSLDEVEVRALKSTMELALDKKIFNVGQDLANTGGNANDILMNIPSVSVDPEGNVKLRGSDNVRILIDGKPSGLVSFKGGSGLQQLQANMIERVEIITNPSARYEAEGMAGIINIVLKKDRSQGFNGSIDFITGYPDNYGATGNFNFRHKRINFFINAGVAYRNQPGDGRMFQRVRDENTLTDSLTRQTTDFTIRGLNSNIRGGMDFFFNEKSILTASYLFRRSDANRTTDIVYRDFFQTESNPTGTTTRRQNEDEIEPNSEYSLIYKKSFAEKNHELVGEVKYLDNWESSDQMFITHVFQVDGTENLEQGRLERSINDESEKQLLFQLDYTKPIGKEGKFETGVRTSFRDMVNDYLVTRRNDNGDFVPVAGLDNVFYYDENIHAAYAILGNKQKKISYQAGVRAEWTDVKTTLAETDEVNPRKYTNLFPSAHVTFDLPKENDIQVSYSRRIRRPFYNDLSPFMTISDSRNFFSGNPNLNPEFSDVYEIGHIKYYDNGSITSSVYNRRTTGKIERIRTVDENGDASTLPQNLLSEVAYGIEFTSNYAPVKWWKVDFNFNFFHAEIDGSNIVDNYKTQTYSWFARQTSRFTLPQHIDLQLRTNYEAPQKLVQGSRKAIFFADFSFSKDVFKGKGTINFTVLDIFNSRRFRSITEGANFYTEGNSQFRKRQFNLTLNYRIKQAKSSKKKSEDEF